MPRPMRYVCLPVGCRPEKVRGSGRGDRISVSDLESDRCRRRSHRSPTPPVRSSKAPRSHADDSQVSATPLARRLAGKLGINLHDCRSSGSRGRVSRDDVLAAALLLDEHPRPGLHKPRQRQPLRRSRCPVCGGLSLLACKRPSNTPFPFERRSRSGTTVSVASGN
jgi:hypothetical protein